MRNPIKSSAGFSIIELLVAALIGLIGTVIIFQMFAVAEGQKRQTTGASDTLQAGAQALFQLERDAMLSGYGIPKQLLGCKVNGWFDNGQPGGQDILIPFLAPVTITDGAGGAPDEVTFLSGTGDMFATPAGLQANQIAHPLEYNVYNQFGFKPGDLMIAMHYKETDPALRDCTLSQISKIEGTKIFHEIGSYMKDGVSKQILFNKPGGLSPPKNIVYKFFSDAGRGGLLFNIGTMPRWLTYRILDGNLVVGDKVAGTDPVIIAENVVQFQAQLGIDGGDHGIAPSTPPTDGAPDGVIYRGNSAPWRPAADFGTGATDHWANALPAPHPAPYSFTAEQWSKVVAIRFAIVTRGDYQKPVGATSCTTTTSNPPWAAASTNPGPITLKVDMLPDWQCYKYEVRELSIPLRNIQWSPSELGIQPTLTL
jgi:type IV pilus assembly protein PilW